MVQDILKPVQILKEKKFEQMTVSIRSDGIACVKIFANLEITIRHVQIVVETLKELGDGAKYPLLFVVLDEYTLPSTEARSYIASVGSNPFAIAEAYVVKSFSQKLVGNVYLSFNKPSRPTRVFNTETRAIEWLKTFL